MSSSGTVRKREELPAEGRKAAKRALTIVDGASPCPSSVSAVLPVVAVVDTQILQLAARWLDPKEIAKCTCVCQQWYKDINNNNTNNSDDDDDNDDDSGSEHIWKQAALNVTSQASLNALAAAIRIRIPGDNTCSGTQLLGYRNMAKGFACSPPTPTSSEEGTPIEWKPQVKGEDMFLLLEMTSFGSTVHAWCKSLEELANQTTKFTFLDSEWHVPDSITIQIPQAQIDAFCWDGTVEDLILKNTTVSLSLWRRDTGQFYCFCKGRENDQVYDTKGDHYSDIYLDDYDEEIGVDPYHEATFLRYDCIQPTRATMAGIFARSMCLEKGIKYVNPEICLRVKPMTPFCDSIQLNDIMIQTRKEGGGMLSSFDFRKVPLAKLGKTRLSGVYMRFWLSVDDENISFDDSSPFFSVDNFLLFMEGLAWK